MSRTMFQVFWLSNFTRTGLGTEALSCFLAIPNNSINSLAMFFYLWPLSGLRIGNIFQIVTVIIIAITTTTIIIIVVVIVVIIVIVIVIIIVVVVIVIIIIIIIVVVVVIIIFIIIIIFVILIRSQTDRLISQFLNEERIVYFPKIIDKCFKN